MMPDIRRSILLAAVGLFGGFALVVALFGTEELFKRNAAVNPSAETPSSPKTPLIGPEAGGRTGESPATDLSHAGPGAPPQAETGAAEAARRDDVAPTFDIVRIEPDGSSVIAGRARPRARIEILRNGQPYASALADAAGQFVLTPSELPPGSSEIALRATDEGGRSMDGRESLTVVVAERRDAKPLVALSAPDRPTRVLSQPEPPSARAQSATVPTDPSGKTASGAIEQGKPLERSADKANATRETIRIVSIDAQEGGRLDVTSHAPTGSTLRLYLNDTLVASGQPGPDGRLAFTIGRGVKPGQYKVRVDSVDPSGGKVRGRAEVAFSYPDTAPSRVADAAPTRSDETRKQAGSAPTADMTAQPRQAGAQPQRDEASPTESRPPRLQTSRHEASGSRQAETSPAETNPPKEKSPKEMPVEHRPAGATLPEPTSPRNLALSVPRKAEPEKPTPERSPELRADAAPSPRDKPDPETPPGSPERVPSTGENRTGTAYVAEISTTRISRGDSLWQISRRTYGRGNRYTVIYDANQDQIRDPDLIYPGQMFVLPKDDPSVGTPSARTGSGRRT